LADIERECVAEIEQLYNGKLDADLRRTIGKFVAESFHEKLKKF
jgi:hypothetical protein